MLIVMAQQQGWLMFLRVCTLHFSSTCLDFLTMRCILGLSMGAVMMGCTQPECNAPAFAEAVGLIPAALFHKPSN